MSADEWVRNRKSEDLESCLIANANLLRATKHLRDDPLRHELRLTFDQAVDGDPIGAINLVAKTENPEDVALYAVLMDKTVDRPVTELNGFQTRLLTYARSTLEEKNIEDPTLTAGLIRFVARFSEGPAACQAIDKIDTLPSAIGLAYDQRRGADRVITRSELVIDIARVSLESETRNYALSKVVSMRQEHGQLGKFLREMLSCRYADTATAAFDTLLEREAMPGQNRDYAIEALRSASGTNSTIIPYVFAKVIEFTPSEVRAYTAYTLWSSTSRMSSEALQLAKQYMSDNLADFANMDYHRRQEALVAAAQSGGAMGTRAIDVLAGIEPKTEAVVAMAGVYRLWHRRTLRFDDEVEAKFREHLVHLTPHYVTLADKDLARSILGRIAHDDGVGRAFGKGIIGPGDEDYATIAARQLEKIPPPPALSTDERLLAACRQA
jgi:hypothetical protein